MKNILLLGGTGSVGSSSLKVIHQNKNEFNLYEEHLFTQDLNQLF